MAIGIVAIVIGCVAIILPAVASVGTAIFIGWILIIVGVFLVAAAFTRARDRSSLAAAGLGGPDRHRRPLADHRTPQRHPDPDPRPRHLLPLHGADPDRRRLPRPRAAERRPGRPQRRLRPADRHPRPGQVPELRRLGDRPAGRHRPDLRRLDADLASPWSAKTFRASSLDCRRCSRSRVQPRDSTMRSGELALVLVMAAGEGTRMRSSTAEDAASRLRAADGRLADPRRARGRRRAGRRRSSLPAATSPPACPRASRRSIQPEADGTGGAIRAAAAADRASRDRARPLRRRPADLRRDDRRPARGARDRAARRRRC